MSNEEQISTDNLLTVIDLGTESIRVMIARVEKDGNYEILGCGDARTNRRDGVDEQALNIRKGKVRNPKEVERKLKFAFDEAYRHSGLTAYGGSVYIGVTDSVYVNNVSMDMPTGRGRTISEEKMAEFMRMVREHYDCLAMNDGRCLHTHTRFFKLADGGCVYDVTGIASKKITAELQGAICRNETVEMIANIVKNVHGITPVLLYIPMAMGQAVDLSEELNNGVLMIDIGAGVVSFCVMRGCCIVHLGHIPIGCNHLENDLMQAFGIEWGTARKIVRKQSDIDANVMNNDDKRHRMVTVETRGSHDGRTQRQRRVPVSSIEKVMMLRLRELFSIVREELVKADVWWHIGGVVMLSGGGALIPGVEGVAENILDKQVQIVKAVDDDGKGVIYKDARDVVPLGLLKLAVRDMNMAKTIQEANEGGDSPLSFLRKLFGALWNW